MKDKMLAFLDDLCSQEIRLTLNGYPASIEQIHAAQLVAEQGCYMADVECVASGAVQAVDFSFVPWKDKSK